jgi:hypothetical protein
MGLFLVRWCGGAQAAAFHLETRDRPAGCNEMQKNTWQLAVR